MSTPIFWSSLPSPNEVPDVNVKDVLFAIEEIVAVLFVFPERKIVSPSTSWETNPVPAPVKFVHAFADVLAEATPAILCVSNASENGFTVKSPDWSNVLRARTSPIAPYKGLETCLTTIPFSTLNNSIKSTSDLASRGSVITFVYTGVPVAGVVGFPATKTVKVVPLVTFAIGNLPLNSDWFAPLITTISPLFKLWSVDVVIVAVFDEAVNVNPEDTIGTPLWKISFLDNVKSTLYRFAPGAV